MPAPQLDMLLDRVDSHDRPVGTVNRRDAFATRANFRVAHILVFNSVQEVLVQHTAPSHSRHPGRWGSSVAGYVQAGERYDAAARRKLHEELRLSGMPLAFCGRTPMVDEGSIKFIGVFTASHDGPFHPSPEAADVVEFLSPDTIELMHRTNARVFTPTFLHVLAYVLTLPLPGP